MGVFDFHGGKTLGLKESYGCKKKIRPPKAAEIFWPFFRCKIKISVGKLFFLTSQEVKFLTFQNFTDVGFATFSILTDVSFGENEIFTNIRFRAFFWAHREEGGNSRTRAQSKLGPNLIKAQSK